MITILSEYFTLATSVKNKKNLKYCLFRSLTFLKPATLSLWTISLDSLVVVKKTFTVTVVANLNPQSR